MTCSLPRAPSQAARAVASPNPPFELFRPSGGAHVEWITRPHPPLERARAPPERRTTTETMDVINVQITSIATAFVLTLSRRLCTTMRRAPIRGFARAIHAARASTPRAHPRARSRALAGEKHSINIFASPSRA